ncbi:MAG: hypothetical protein WC807_14455 [Hyphomicrobium sp.]
MTSFKDRYGYPLWMPVAGIMLLLAGAGSMIAAFYTMNIRWLLVTLAVVFLLGLPAKAHDHNRPDLDSWYPTLRSPAGAPCCDGPSVDAVHLADVDWESRDGRYRVRIDGQWVDVPPGAVLDGPNRDGRALVWPTWSDGKRAVRCFMPGAMG